MSCKNYLAAALAAGALGLGVSPSRASGPAEQPQPPQASAQSEAKISPLPNQSTKPPKDCRNGKMRCIDNDMRWQAAINNANRIADNVRKHGLAKGHNK